MVQSFPKGADVDPATAHAAALKLAEYFGGHEVLVCTHTDREHIHSHFIINSVSFDSGKKLHLAKEQLQELRQRNDEVCMQFSLPVFVPNPNRQKSKRMTIGEYHMAKRGISKKFQLMAVIQECMRHAATKDDFIALMESEGYKITWTPKRREITYISATGWRCCDTSLFQDRFLKERMEHEFEIRAELLYGRAHGDEPSSAYEAGRSGADYTADAGNAVYRNTLSAPGGDGRGERVSAQSGKQVFQTGDSDESARRKVQSIGDTGADGRTAEGGEASGGDDRTGWETEREIFFAAQNQTAQAAPVSSGMGLADSGHDYDGTGYGSVTSALVQVGRRLEQSQSAEPVIDSTTQHHHTDSKAFRKEKEKKIALGHKADDHEDEQTHTWQQTM